MSIVSSDQRFLYSKTAQRQAHGLAEDPAARQLLVAVAVLHAAHVQRPVGDLRGAGLVLAVDAELQVEVERRPGLLLQEAGEEAAHLLHPFEELVGRGARRAELRVAVEGLAREI